MLTHSSIWKVKWQMIKQEGRIKIQDADFDGKEKNNEGQNK
jgi:major membrane immunogen (membrane-anchored lipoprotein)